MIVICKCKGRIFQKQNEQKRRRMDNERREIIQEPEKYIKSNFLVSSKYRSTLFENKLMALSLYHIDEAQFDTSGALVQEISAAEVRRRFGIKGNGLYGQLDRAARNMTGQTIGMTNPEDKFFDYIAVIIRSTYKNGKLTIKYNQDIAQYMTEIKNNYTQYPLDIMMKFKSNSSFRLYEVLRSKAYYKKGDTMQAGDVFRFTISLSELKLTMGIVNANLDSVKNILNGSKTPDYDKAVEKSPEKLFEDWRNFKTQVLEVAIKEINESSDLNVEYEVMKEGKGGKIHDIIFYVKYKTSEEEDIAETDEKKKLTEEQKEQFIDEIIDMIEEKVRIKDIRTLCEIADYDKEKIEKAYRIVKSSATPVKSLVGYMISAIKEDYPEPVAVESGLRKKQSLKNSFLNFEQRDYDYEQLEIELLNSRPCTE